LRFGRYKNSNSAFLSSANIYILSIIGKMMEPIARGKYLVPLEDIKTYVEVAVRKLNLDAKLITDMDSAMYAHRLSFHPDNINVARSALGLGSASLSQIARAMADAGLEEASRIEHDPSYHMPPLRELSSGEITLSR